LLRLPVETGMLYAKIRYGLDFDTDSPVDAVGHSSTPVLLIHGTKDINILPHHSELIAARYPSRVVLWEVPGAAHCGASVVAQQMFWTKVLTWFGAHAQRPSTPSSARRIASPS
jgi:dipeptidyl aminopeptidase/acylaminoacyl peptidase